MSMRTIGRYEIQELIGDGGMGTVWLGNDPMFNRPVAVKVLHSHLVNDPEVLERFKTEAVIQARLMHPNIVTVYDFVIDQSSVAIVMERIQGKPLDEVIEKQGALPPNACRQIMVQVLSALEVAHKQGLVHRDIKPSNILLDQQDGGIQAKLSDFGVAKVLGSEKMRTATSAKMGTIYYMSPEQLRSPKHVDLRTDIYSLGVMLYQMATGRLPFDADTEFEMMRQTIEEVPPSPMTLNPGIPAGLNSVIHRALEKQPNDRFQTCAEFRQAIEGWESWSKEPSRTPAQTDQPFTLPQSNIPPLPPIHNMQNVQQIETRTTPTSATQSHQKFSPVLAGRGTRLGAFLIDYFMFVSIWVFSLIVSYGIGSSGEQVLTCLGLIFIIILAIIQMILLSKEGQTIGKKLVGIKIVNRSDGQNGGFVHNVLLRLIINGLIGIIPFLGIAYFIVDSCFIFQDDRRCIHDLIAGTIVIKA